MQCPSVVSRRTRPVFVVASLLALVSFHPAAAQQAPAATDGVNQLLRPGDVVRLRIWREPDLSGDYDVDELGVAVFPKIGPLAVGRLTTDSVRTYLVATYTRFLQQPSVEVMFLRRINVLGWVRNPGLYHVDATMTLADVLAMAGGVTDDGNVKKIALYRGGQQVPGVLSEQSLLADLPLRSGDQLRVPQRSWMSRNSPVVIGASISGVALIAAALLRW